MYFSHKINVEKCAEILPNWENMDKVPLTSKENNICYICKKNKLCGRRDQNCDISNCASKIIEVYKPGLNVVNMGNTIWMTKSRYLKYIPQKADVTLIFLLIKYSHSSGSQCFSMRLYLMCD